MAMRDQEKKTLRWRERKTKRPTCKKRDKNKEIGLEKMKNKKKRDQKDKNIRPSLRKS